MAFIKEIQTPDNNKYQIKNTIIPVNGTQNIATNTWIGNIDVPSLYDGLTIIYHLPYASEGEVTLNLTLSSGVTTGEIKVYLDKNRLSGQLDEGIDITLTYQSAGSISIDGVSTIDDRWIAQIDTLYDFKAGNKIGYFKVKDNRGKENEISPYYGYGIDSGDLPLIIDSVEGEVDEITINGNDEPNRIDTTEGILPMTVSAYGGNTTDWEIYGNNNPVVENKTGVLPIEASAAAGNVLDWTVDGNNNIGKNVVQLGESQTKDGITLTIDNQAGTATLNGDTTAAESGFSVTLFDTSSLVGGDYIFSGGADGGSSTTYDLYLYNRTDQIYMSHLYNSSDATIVTIESGKRYVVYLQCRKAQVYNNIVFKPMLRPANTTSTFEPYKVGVGERTSNIVELESENVNPRITVNTLQNSTGTVWGTTSGGANYIDFAFYPSFEEGKTYTISFNNLYTENTMSRVTIRRKSTYQIRYTSSLTTYGEKSFSFTYTAAEFPNGAYVSILLNNNTGAAGELHIENLMLVEGNTAPESFVPYGYKIPMQAKQRTKNLYNITNAYRLTAGVTAQEEDGRLHIFGNSTNSANHVLGIMVGSLLTQASLEAGQYVLSGAVANTNSNYRIQLLTVNPDSSVGTVIGYDSGGGLEFTLEEPSTVCMRIYVKSAAYQQDVDLLFSPMIRRADTSSDFEPYYNINQTDIYIGNSPLTQGQSITKAQSGQNITLFSGDNIIDTTLYNKPTTSITYNSSVLGVGQHNINLFNATIEQGGLNSGSEYGSNTRIRTTFMSNMLDAGTYTINASGVNNVVTNYFDDNKTYTGGVTTWRTLPFTFNISNRRYVRFAFKISDSQNVTPSDISNIMLVEGSTAPSTFVPYGYEIPITVQGENLFDKTATDVDKGFEEKRYIRDNGSTIGNANWNISEYLDVQSSSRYILIYGSNNETPGVCYYTSEKEYISGVSYNGQSVIVLDIPSNAKYIRFSYMRSNDINPILQRVYDYDIYIGSEPLTEGQSISKTSTSTDIALLSGTNTISTTLGNKPEMRIDYLSAEVGVGEPTANLFDAEKYVAGVRTINYGVSEIAFTSTEISVTPNINYNTWYVGTARKKADGNVPSTAGTQLIKIDAEGEQTYTLNLSSSNTLTSCYLTFTNENFETLNENYIFFSSANLPLTFTTLQGTKYIFLRLGNSNVDSVTIIANVMLVKGSAPPSEYVPFGYQIPLTVEGGVTENLFDGNFEQGGWTGTIGNAASKYSSTTRVRCSAIFDALASDTYTVTCYPTTLQIAVILTDANGNVTQSTSWTNAHTINNLKNCVFMIRKSNNTDISPSDIEGVCIVKGSTAPDHYIPYHNTTQTNIYIGTSLLTQGESVTKTKEELNINTYFGENIIDSAVYNPPSISIKHPQEIEPYLNNYINQKISIYNTETIIPQFLERKEIDNHLADTIGTKGSINLFPIDKGVLGDPFIYSQTEGEFYIMQGDSSRDNISSIAFIGLTNSTSETTVTYKAFFNYNYQYSDHSFLFGDLLPGDYVLDYETLEDDFSDVGEIYYEVYEALDSSGGGDLIASGQSVEFTVTEEKPYIMIEIIAKRNSGYNWEEAYLWFIPFLRRKYFENEDVDSYIPSIKKLSDPKSYWLSTPTDSGMVIADSSTGKLKTNNGIIFDGNNHILKIGNNNNYGSIQLQAGSSLLYNTIIAGTCVQPVIHTLPSTTGTLINNTDYNNSEITIYESYNSNMSDDMFPNADPNNPDEKGYNITYLRDKIKYIDIYFTDNNYYKGFSGGVNIVSENYGYLRIPYDQISKDALADSTRFSLFLFGDQNSFYLRKRTYYIYENESSPGVYRLYMHPSTNNRDLTLQFYGNPGTYPNWSDMTVKGTYTPCIKVYMIKLVLEL